jgi:hypothetical protein
MKIEDCFFVSDEIQAPYLKHLTMKFRLVGSTLGRPRAAPAARQDEEEMHVGVGVFGSIGREEGDRMGISGEEPDAY